MDIKEEITKESGMEKLPNDWPPRDGTVSELEEALHNYLDWGRIAVLRSKYDYPAVILDKDKEELVEEISRPAEDIESIQSLIRSWDSDPEGFKNPFREKSEQGRVMVPVKPQFKAETVVKEN